MKNSNGVSVSMVDSGSSAEKNGLEVRRFIKSMNGRLVSGIIEFKGVLDFFLGESEMHLLILRSEEKFHNSIS